LNPVFSIAQFVVWSKAHVIASEASVIASEASVIASEVPVIANEVPVIASDAKQSALNLFLSANAVTCHGKSFTGRLPRPLFVIQ
jgi:hypothetical protein